MTSSLRSENGALCLVVIKENSRSGQILWELQRRRLTPLNGKRPENQNCTLSIFFFFFRNIAFIFVMESQMVRVDLIFKSKAQNWLLAEYFSSNVIGLLGRRVSSVDPSTPASRTTADMQREQQLVSFCLFFPPLEPIQHDPMLSGLKGVGVNDVITAPLSRPGWVTKTIAPLAAGCDAGPSSPHQSGHWELWATSGVTAELSNQLLLRQWIRAGCRSVYP